MQAPGRQVPGPQNPHGRKGNWILQPLTSTCIKWHTYPSSPLHTHTQNKLQCRKKNVCFKNRSHCVVLAVLEIRKWPERPWTQREPSASPLLELKVWVTILGLSSFLRQGLTVQPKLAWNLLYNLHLSRTHGHPPASPLTFWYYKHALYPCLWSIFPILFSVAVIKRWAKTAWGKKGVLLTPPGNSSEKPCQEPGGWD